MSALAPMTAEHWVRVIEYEGDMLYRCKYIITRVGGGARSSTPFIYYG